jgi:hypothetical protein
MGHTSRSTGLLRVEVSLVRVRRDDGWCMWHHRGGCVELKLKTDGSMRWAASDPSTPTLPFFLY